MFLTVNALAFTNQKCYYEKPDEIKSIRLLPKNTTTAPCTVEIERKINGKNIKYIKYKSEKSFNQCDKAAIKELMETFAKGFQCEDDK